MSLGMVVLMSACSFVRRGTPLSLAHSSSLLRAARSHRYLRLAAESTSSSHSALSESALPKGSAYWRSKLSELSRPAAVHLVPQLSPENALGYMNKVQSKASGPLSLVDFAVAQKDKHPEKVLLFRVGEFYEAFGSDALMLVEHAGLNPMGGKCRAGCPVSNVQPTLDSLTSAGLSVAVYEETGPPPTKGERIKRQLMQVVTRASPTYLHERLLSPEHIQVIRRHPPFSPYVAPRFPHMSEINSLFFVFQYEEPPPYAAISVGASGYTFVQVHVDARVYRVMSRLSLAALRAQLLARPVAPPLLVRELHGHTLPAHLPFVPKERRTLASADGCRSARGFAQAVLEHVADDVHVPIESFTLANASDRASLPRPLYVNTASQIGLLPAAGIPDLARALLPSRGALSESLALLRRWLLLPPAPRVADAMRLACAELEARDLDMHTHTRPPLTLTLIPALPQR